jgi:hypothetical protein
MTESPNALTVGWGGGSDGVGVGVDVGVGWAAARGRAWAERAAGCGDAGRAEVVEGCGVCPEEASAGDGAL